MWGGSGFAPAWPAVPTPCRRHGRSPARPGASADRAARERQVLTQVAAGRLNKQIAAELGIGEKTGKFHRGNLMKKPGVGSIAELVRLAERTAGASAGSLRLRATPAPQGDTGPRSS